MQDFTEIPDDEITVAHTNFMWSSEVKQRSELS